MSSTPIENFEYFHRQQTQESPSNCEECRRSRLELQQSSSSQGSSSQNESQSISIHVNADTMKNQSSRLQKLQGQVDELRLENRLLSRKNKELMKQLVPITNSQKELKRQLKVKQREMAKIKNQVSINSYGISHMSRSQLESEMNSPKVIYEEKNYRLRSKSGRKSKQSGDSSINKEFYFDDIKIKKKQWQIERTNYEKKIYELQEKMVFYESQINWTANLSYKLISMAEKLGLVFKQRIIKPNESLKQQAKSGWRYIKHVLSYLLEID